MNRNLKPDLEVIDQNSPVISADRLRPWASHPRVSASAVQRRMPADISPFVALFLLLLVLIPALKVSAADPTGARVGELGSKEALIFHGNESYSKDSIYDGLKMQMAYQLAAHPSAPLADYPKTLREMIIQGYLRGGFSDPKVEVTVKPGQTNILIQVQEGPRFTAGEVRFKGAPAIADPELQQKLLLALAGVELSPTNSAEVTTNRLRARWTKDKPVPFDNLALEQLKNALTGELERQNYFRPGINVEIATDTQARTAELIVNMIDEGLRGSLEEFEFHYPAREKKNTDAELMDFLGLTRGMQFSARLLEQVEKKLWDSGRFFRSAVEVHPLPGTGRFKLVAHLEDLDAAPPLRVALTTTQAVLLKLCGRLNELDQHDDDLVITASAPPGHLAELKSLSLEAVVSRSGVGLVLRSQESNSAPRMMYATVLSETLGFYSGWKKRKLVLHDPQNVKAFFTLLPSDAGVEQEFSMSMGAGFGARDQPSGKAVDWTLKVAPAAFLREEARQSGWLTISNGLLVGTLSTNNTDSSIKIDVATGRLVEGSITETNNLGLQVRYRMEAGAYTRLIADIDRDSSDFRDAYKPEFPLSSVFGLLLSDYLESGFLESAALLNASFTGTTQQDRDSFTNSAAQVRVALSKIKAALGKEELADCLTGFEAELQKVLAALRKDKVSAEVWPFEVPMRIDATNQANQLMGLVGSFLISASDTTWPRGSWPWVLTRETGFTLAGENRYTAAELQRLLASEKMGPLGNWAAGALLAKVNAPMAEQFMKRGLNQLAAENLAKDLQVLLDPESLAGKLANKALVTISRFEDSDLAKIAELLDPDRARLLQELSGTLRARTNQPPAVAIEPLLTSYWQTVFKPGMEPPMKQLLAKVGTPTDPEAAYQRARFIMQSKPQADQFKQARELFLFAAGQGHGGSQEALGQIYLNGIGVDKDETEAFKWLLKAAEQDVPHAGCRVADMYAAGAGVDKDEAKALEWFKHECKHNCPRSQFMVARHYEGTSKMEEALIYYRQAASNGVVQAQMVLGERLTDGFSTTVNNEEAYLWYALAADGGDRVAAVSARRLRAKLSEAELERCERVLEDARKRHQKN